MQLNTLKNTMKLRGYQQTAVDRILWDRKNPGNSIICLPQGSGKSLVIAAVADKLQAPVLIICPNKEILEQDLEKMTHYMKREDIGVFSASMNEKTIKRVTFGTIQSMYKKTELFKEFDIVIYDECDLHNPKNLEGMSSTLFKEAGIRKVFGFTGTPYRQDFYYEKWGKENWMLRRITTTKMIQRMKPFFWSRMLMVVNTKDLLELGYLSPIEYHDISLVQHEQLKTNKSQSDFDLEDFEKRVCNQYTPIADFLKENEKKHKAQIVYCASVGQAEALQSLVGGSKVVTATTGKKEREAAADGLRRGEIKTLFNVGIYTVGFDYPALDAIVLLRPTRSLRLHSQILGRVSRIAEGKTVGHVYDLVNNVASLGALDDIRVVKDYTGKWNVISSAYPNGFHYAPLYSYKLPARRPE